MNQLPAGITTAVPMVVQAETITFLPVLAPEDLLARRKELLEVVKNVLKEGDHYGRTPGTNKPSLLKPGAEILNQYFGLYAEFELTASVENWDRQPPLFDYTFKCAVRSKRDGAKVSEGVGSCNSYESKYKYRDAKRSCPGCGRNGTIIKGKEEYGGGWLCWTKDPAGCCKAKYSEQAPEIVNQPIGKVENEDLPSLKNTILKMAAKRAYVDATLKATGASELFTEDIEDLPFTVEIISAEVVNEASQQQDAARKASNGKPAGNSDPKPASASVAAQEKTPASGNAPADAPATGGTDAEKKSGATAQGAQSPATAGNAQSAGTQSASSGNRVTQEQIKTLLAAGAANGWSREQIAAFCCFAFAIADPKQFAKVFTVKQREIAVALISHPTNKNNTVTVTKDGKPLPADKCWPQTK